MSTPTFEFDGANPEKLKEQGNAALKTDVQLATRLYTLGIDLALGGSNVPRPTTSAAWYAAEQRAEPTGVLHKLLSNRSLAHRRAGDADAAIDDARACCACAPGFAKGHLRLLAALTAAGVPRETIRRTAARALLACPTDAALRAKVDTIERDAATAASLTPGAAARASAAAGPSSAAAASSSKTQRAVSFEEDGAPSRLAETRRVADDASDPRRAMAAADLGAALAVGAHGVAKDGAEAERYLRVGVEGGDAVAHRHLALLLLDQGRAGRSGAASEAAGLLRVAADRGDDEAKEILAALGAEAKQQAEHARFRLEALATTGDPRAIEILNQLREEERVARRG